MEEKLRQILEQFTDLEKKFLDPSVMSDPEQLKELGKKRSKIVDAATMGKRFFELQDTIAEAKEMLTDPEMKDLAKEELDEAEKEKEKIETILKEELTPKDPNDPKNVILEIRAGAGGDEAGIFAADLSRMYIRFAENQEFDAEIISKSDNESGGIKEMVIEIAGKNVYKNLKFESGVHRVQRIPKTESQGRIHTSTATVAVVPEADDDVEIEIKKEDVRVDTYRASGAGGQHVNKTESAIRLTHIPTGLVVTCQDQSSQHKNKDKAFKVLKSRLVQIEEDKRIAEDSEIRVAQIGTGDRSEKIRTYNYPQDRITDHRIKKNFPNIPAVMDGEILGIIQACAVAAEESQ